MSTYEIDNNVQCIIDGDGRAVIQPQNEFTPKSFELPDGNLFDDDVSIISVRFAYNISYIGEDNFTNSNVFSVELPPNIEIGNGAFANCENLSTVEGLAYAKEIGDEAFINAPLDDTEIYIGEDCELVGENAFAGGQFEHVEVDAKLVKDGAFSLNSELKTCKIGPDTIIDGDPFKGCDKEKLEITVCQLKGHPSNLTADQLSNLGYNVIIEEVQPSLSEQINNVTKLANRNSGDRNNGNEIDDSGDRNDEPKQVDKSYFKPTGTDDR